ncbi:hypothetical protein H7E67_01905 [Clostridium gasigenes]|uniref:hypothetical protein n=1 Tax=Clostridium gasigenes TaxID=94869 RepID=UPI001624A768|nr:hypothetical protein [Clostridium gasigenes]MBB6622174.1 hypothetical protein [Clostridium gasigenes]
MFCVIQEIEIKKANKYGACKEIEVYQYDWTMGDEPKQWNYRYSKEKFERSIKKAYKISIHESYREGGIVKKKQWVICTMDYYSIAEHNTWIRDFKIGSQWDKLLNDINISEEKLCEIVYKKLDSLITKIQTEYEATEEFIVNENNKSIVKKYIQDKSDFKIKYSSNDYDECFDVFGTLRNEKHLKEIKSDYEAQQTYQRSYQENKHSNYNYNSYSSYQEIKPSNYKEEDKEHLKNFYRLLAKSYHPDICKDEGEAMKLLNQLKEQWGI